MTDPRTIAVCFSRPLFATSALEAFAEQLVGTATRHGHDVTVVTLPSLKDTTGPDARRALEWALVDLTELGTGRAIDAAVCLHPDALFLRHPVKVAWLPCSAKDDDRVRQALQLARRNEAVPTIVDANADAETVVETVVAIGSDPPRSSAVR